MPFSAAAALAIIIFASAGREIEFSSSETFFSGFLSLPASFPQIFRDFSRFFGVFPCFLRFFAHFWFRRFETYPISAARAYVY